jgi:hypothetical protein
MYIDINTLFTFEVSKSDDQSILAAILHSPFKNQKTTNVAFSSIITIGNAV